MYLFCGLVNGDGFVTNFITIVTLLAFDFWTVKNISGRLLVGLRWWNKVTDTLSPSKSGSPKIHSFN